MTSTTTTTPTTTPTTATRPTFETVIKDLCIYLVGNDMKSKAIFLSDFLKFAEERKGISHVPGYRIEFPTHQGKIMVQIYDSAPVVSSSMITDPNAINKFIVFPVKSVENYLPANWSMSSYTGPSLTDDVYVRESGCYKSGADVIYGLACNYRGSTEKLLDIFTEGVIPVPPASSISAPISPVTSVPAAQSKEIKIESKESIISIYLLGDDIDAKSKFVGELSVVIASKGGVRQCTSSCFRYEFLLRTGSSSDLKIKIFDNVSVGSQNPEQYVDGSFYIMFTTCDKVGNFLTLNYVEASKLRNVYIGDGKGGYRNVGNLSNECLSFVFWTNTTKLFDGIIGWKMSSSVTVVKTETKDSRTIVKEPEAKSDMSLTPPSILPVPSVSDMTNATGKTIIKTIFICCLGDNVNSMTQFFDKLHDFVRVKGGTQPYGSSYTFDMPVSTIVPINYVRIKIIDNVSLNPQGPVDYQAGTIYIVFAKNKNIFNFLHTSVESENKANVYIKDHEDYYRSWGREPYSNELAEYRNVSNLIQNIIYHEIKRSESLKKNSEPLDVKSEVTEEKILASPDMSLTPSPTTTPVTPLSPATPVADTTSLAIIKNINILCLGDDIDMMKHFFDKLYDFVEKRRGIKFTSSRYTFDIPTPTITSSNYVRVKFMDSVLSGFVNIMDYRAGTFYIIFSKNKGVSTFLNFTGPESEENEANIYIKDQEDYYSDWKRKSYRGEMLTFKDEERLLGNIIYRATEGKSGELRENSGLLDKNSESLKKNCGLLDVKSEVIEKKTEPAKGPAPPDMSTAIVTPSPYPPVPYPSVSTYPPPVSILVSVIKCMVQSQLLAVNDMSTLSHKDMISKVCDLIDQVYPDSKESHESYAQQVLEIIKVLGK